MTLPWLTVLALLPALAAVFTAVAGPRAARSVALARGNPQGRVCIPAVAAP